MSVVVTLFGKDKLSGPFGKGASSIVKMGKAVGRLGLKFVKFGALAGAAIAGVSLKLAADLEEGLREVGTLMGGLTNNEMRAMTKELEALASASGKAIDGLVKARYDIVSAGFGSAADSALLLNQATQLAIGGVSDVAASADLLTTIMNSYNLAAGDAALISDKLFKTVELGKTTIDRMAGSLGRVAGIAGTLGIDMDELLAAFATLTTATGSSERAVTAVSGSIAAMLTPTADLEKITKELGFATSFALIQSEGFAGSIRLIKEKADELDIPLTRVISGMEGLSGVLPLTGVLAEKFAKNIVLVGDSAGATALAVSEMEKSFSQDTRKLKQNVNNILREIGRSLIEVIQPKVKEANEILSSLGAIGWDVVGQVILENWDLALDALLQISKVVGPQIGRALQAGIEIGLKGLVEAIRNVTTRPLAKLLFGWAIKVEDDVGGSFESLGGSVSEIITNLLIEVKTLADETAPALKKIERAVEKVTGAVEISQEEWEELVALLIGVNGVAGNVGNTMIKMGIAFSVAAGEASDFATNILIITDNMGKLTDKTRETITKLKALGGILSTVAKFFPSDDGEKKEGGISIGSVFSFLADLAKIAAAVAVFFDKGGVISQQLAMGGNVNNLQHAQFGRFVSGRGAVPIIAHAGEIVSTQNAAALFGPQIAQMNQMAEGLGGGRSGGDTFFITAVDALSFENMLKRNGLALGRGIRQASRDRNLTNADLPA